MAKQIRSIKRVHGVRIIVSLAIVGALAVQGFSSFYITRQSEIDRLQTIATLASERVMGYLQATDTEATQRDLESLSLMNDIDTLELYKSDGTILTAYGAHRQNLPESFLLGENVSYSWPLTFRFQHSKIFLHQGKPLGFLVLYSSLKKDSLFWIVSSMAAAIFCFSVLILLLYTVSRAKRREHRRADGQGGTNHGNRTTETALVAEGLEEGGVEQLVMQRDRALASAKAKGDFLANMSHEIRTAMNGVVGILSLLQKSGIEGEKRRLLDAASRSSDSLLLIINDILDFSKIEAGKIDFEHIVFDLRQVVEECMALYIDTARAKNIGLHCFIPLDIPTNVKGDPTRLRQIVTNLLSNAVKFTETGEVSLSIRGVEKTENRQQLLFSVEDTGIGIPPEKLDSIFDMFIQADDSTTRRYGGTGLGLSVCKQLIELQDGEVGVKSRPGRGTSFWFTLQFETDDSEAQGYAVSHELLGKHYGLFDPCETCTTIITQYLRGCSVDSFSCETVIEIIAHLKELEERGRSPGVVLVDYSIVEKNTDECIRSISELYPGGAPAMYVLSRKNGIAKDLKRKGVAGVIHKPVRLQQLHEELAGHASTADQDTRQDWREQLEGVVLLVDDEQVNQHVGQVLLRKLGLTVDVANNGSQAMEQITRRKYDLVLMDLQMPGISGIEAARAIREREMHEAGERLTIIAVTANALTTVRQECLEAGMDDFIPKPIKPDQLLQKLRPWLKKQRGEPSAMVEAGADRKQEEADGHSADSLRVWNRPAALEYVGGDESLLTDLMQLFLERKDVLLGDIDRAMETADGEAVSCAAHAFKGAVNHFAAERCQRLALQLENRAGEGWFEGIEQCAEDLRNAAEILEKELRQHLQAEVKPASMVLNTAAAKTEEGPERSFEQTGRL